MSIYANCEVYTNEAGDLAVLTRVDPADGYERSFLHGHDPEDCSVNLDRRVIEFHLEKPNKHTYKEWNEFLKSLGYPALYLPTRQDEWNNSVAVDEDELAEGFKLTWVPSGNAFRIIREPVFVYYPTPTVTDEQVVEITDEDDWILWKDKASEHAENTDELTIVSE